MIRYHHPGRQKGGPQDHGEHQGPAQAVHDHIIQIGLGPLDDPLQAPEQHPADDGRHHQPGQQENPGIHPGVCIQPGPDSVELGGSHESFPKKLSEPAIFIDAL